MSLPPRVAFNLSRRGPAPVGAKFASLLTCNATEWSSFGVVFGNGDEEGVEDDVVFGQAAVSAQTWLTSAGWKSMWTDAAQGERRGTRGGAFVAAKARRALSAPRARK